MNSHILVSYCSIAMVTVETLLCYVRYQKQQNQDGAFFLSPFALELVKNVLSLCQQLWFTADERRREKEAQEESLYQFKPRTFEINEREEDIMIARELNKLFPSFEAEFDNEERTDLMENDDSDQMDQSTPSSFSQFTDDEMQLIFSLHLTTFTSSLTPSLHYSLSFSRILDVVKQLQQRHEMEGSSSPHDGLVVGGLARMCHQLTCHVTSSDDTLQDNR